MKRILLNLIFIFLFKFSFSQEIDNEVNNFFLDEEHQTYVNQNGYYFIDIPKEKSYQNRLSGILQIKDTSYIDFKEINVSFSKNDYRYYLISNLETIMVLKSINHIKKEMDLNE